jgi:hypothetical protein
VTGIVAGPVPPGSNAGTCTVTGCTGITVGAGETLSYTVSATVENPLTQTGVHEPDHADGRHLRAGRV